MPKKPAPSQVQDRYIVRLPDGMRERIAEVAKENNRSMNAEIVARLVSSFQPLETSRPEEVEELIARTVHQAIGVTIRSLQESGWKPPLPPTKGKSKGGV